MKKFNVRVFMLLAMLSYCVLKAKGKYTLPEPLGNFIADCFQPFAIFSLTKRTNQKNCTETTGFSRVRCYDEKGIAIFVLKK
jgi:hypothetical protein